MKYWSWYHSAAQIFRGHSLIFSSASACSSDANPVPATYADGAACVASLAVG